MAKPVRVLLVTGSGVSALDFERLLDNLHRAGASAGDPGLHGRHDSQHDWIDEVAQWECDQELARARDFINRQHAGEPWFCYVNLGRAPSPLEQRRSTRPPQRIRADRIRSGVTSKPGRSH
jgi:hypothetical protein